jgi:hypothetical protein
MEHFHRLLAFQDYREIGKARENQPQAYYDAFSEAYALGEQNAYNRPIYSDGDSIKCKRSAQEDDRL